MNEMFDDNKEGTERKCNECGKIKPDVKFRTWGGIDAAEWDIICADCLKKKEREMQCFWVLLASVVAMGFAMLLAFAALVIFL